MKYFIASLLFAFSTQALADDGAFVCKGQVLWVFADSHSKTYVNRDFDIALTRASEKRFSGAVAIYQNFKLEVSVEKPFPSMYVVLTQPSGEGRNTQHIGGGTYGSKNGTEGESSLLLFNTMLYQKARDAGLSYDRYLTVSDELPSVITPASVAIKCNGRW